MKQNISRILALLFVTTSGIQAAEPDDDVFMQRRDATFTNIQVTAQPLVAKNPDLAHHVALLLLFRNENIAEANRLVLSYCGADSMTTYVGKPVPKGRSEALLRIYLLERTRKLLSKEAREAIETFAWDLLTTYPLGMSRETVEKAELAHFLLPNNGQTDKWRRYFLSLQIVRKAERYGPKAMLEGDTVENHVQAWNRFWIKFFHVFPNEGTDMDIAHPTSYGECTVGVFYDLFDLADAPELRRLAGNFLTLYWAEVASEFDPRNGERPVWPPRAGRPTPASGASGRAGSCMSTSGMITASPTLPSGR